MGIPLVKDKNASDSDKPKHVTSEEKKVEKWEKGRGNWKNRKKTGNCNDTKFFNIYTI